MSIKNDELIYELLNEYEENKGLTTEMLLKMLELDFEEERNYAKKVLAEFDKIKGEENE